MISDNNIIALSIVISKEHFHCLLVKANSFNSQISCVAPKQQTYLSLQYFGFVKENIIVFVILVVLWRISAFIQHRLKHPPNSAFKGEGPIFSLSLCSHQTSRVKLTCKVLSHLSNLKFAMFQLNW